MLEDYKNIVLIGVGGIGMSALARFFKRQGKVVIGYDKTDSDLIQELKSEGVEVWLKDVVPASFSSLVNKNTLVIFTPAVPDDQTWRVWFMANGFEMIKRAQALGTVSSHLNSICVAGTHGKTTVSTMTAHLLKQSVLDCHAFLGGISKNYQTNYLSSDSSNWIVLEADEFDRSFLQLTPQLAVITSTDADHLDIYGDKNQVEEAFNLFAQKVKSGGSVLVKNGCQVDVNNLKSIKTYSYSLNSGGDYYASDIALTDGLYSFTLNTPSGKIPNLKLGIPGLLNIENAVSASSLALLAGVSATEIAKGLLSFKGIKRRFDYWINHPKFAFIDDYAHHPEEIKATASSIRAIYGNKKIVALFQPHLYSRTNDFHVEFGHALSLFDEVLLLDIYPARELPIPGVDSHLIAKSVSSPCSVINKDDVVHKVLLSRPDVLVTMGAGDIDRLLPKMKSELEAILT